MAVCAVWLVAALTAASRAADPPRPVVHLLAPSEKYANTYDPFPAETALRLVAAELAARHGVYARFWPVDRHKALPQDAWPRVEVTTQWGGRPRFKHLRLVRRGDLFEFLGSLDGRDYLLLGRYIAKVKPKL
jgi:hypothetical protein